MGLDNYPTRIALRAPDWEPSLSWDDYAAFRVADLSMVSIGDTRPWVHIRGSLYTMIVEAATDYTLYTEWLPPEHVARLAWQLREWDPDDAVLDTAIWRGDSQEERHRSLNDLCRFFDICVERGLGLEGSW